MTRTHYDAELREIEADLLALGRHADVAIGHAITSLLQADVALADQVCAADVQIDRMRYRLEERTLKVVALQQPVATDLRLIAAVFALTTELERIADHAKGIARITTRITTYPCGSLLSKLPEMGSQAQQMLVASMAAFAARDTAQARAIARSDDIMDDLYNQVYHHLLAAMQANPLCTEVASLLLYAAHHLERIGDRATNICERTLYVIEGRIVDLGNDPDA